MDDGPKNYAPLLRQVAVDHGCTELAAFDVQSGVGNFRVLYHDRGGTNVDESERHAAIDAFAKLIAPCVASKKDGAIELATTRASGRSQYCLIILAHRGDSVVGAAAFIARCADRSNASNLLQRIKTDAERFRNGPPATDAH